MCASVFFLMRRSLQGSDLAPPRNLMLTAPTVAVQLAMATDGRPVSSLRTEMLALMDRSLIPRLKEPLSFLFQHQEESVMFKIQEV